MVKNERNKSTFFQWDTNQKIRIPHVNVDSVAQVHFSSISDRIDEAFVVTPVVIDDIICAEVPNTLLQHAGKIFVYLYCKSDDGFFSESAGALTVLPREKPADYVLTEEDAKSWAELEIKINGKLDSYYGIENAGKILIVGEDGRVTATEHTESGNSNKDIGELSDLRTESKDNLVGAINEMVDSFDNIEEALNNIEQTPDVHVGDDEPTNGETVWINLNEKQNGRPSNNDGMYELIETINGSGEFVMIDRTKEPDGTSYRFSRMIVRTKVVNSDADQLMNVFFSITPRVNGTIATAFLKSKTSYGWAKGWAENGRMFTETGTGHPYPNSMHNIYGTAYDNLLREEIPITRLNIQTVGTVTAEQYTIEIWAVRV